MNSSTDELIAIKDELWAKMEAQKAEELELRRAEYLQASEIALVNKQRIDADVELAKQRAEDNRLRNEQNLLIQELIITVRHMVVFIEEGEFDSKIDKLNEGQSKLNESQNNLVKVVEWLIPVILNKDDVSPENILKMTKSSYIINEREFEETLVKLLSECQSINRNFDELVADMLPVDIRDNVNQGGALRVRVRQLVRACGAYNAWEELLRVLKFYEGDSVAVGDVAKFLRQTGRV